jgi:hypothetical protein
MNTELPELHQIVLKGADTPIYLEMVLQEKAV